MAKKNIYNKDEGNGRLMNIKMARPANVGDEDPEATIRKMKTVEVSDANVVARAFLRLKIAEYCNMILAIFGIGCAIIERELSAKFGINGQKTLRISLLSANLIVTIFLLFTIYITYKLRLNLEKKKGQ